MIRELNASDDHIMSCRCHHEHGGHNTPQEDAHTHVRPAAMHKQQTLQKPKLCKRVVTREHGLPSFEPTDTNTNVCLDTERRLSEEDGGQIRVVTSCG